MRQIILAYALFLAGFAHAGTVRVAIKTVKRNQGRYDPSELRVRAGTTVRWTNFDDHEVHTVTSGTWKMGLGKPDGIFASKILRPGQSFEYTFKKKGRFNYYCVPHMAMGMVGEVDVR